MRIAFIGTVDFSRHCLEQVLETDGDVVAVFTPFQENAKLNADYTDIAPVAERHGVPVTRFANINSPEIVADMRNLKPDVILVLGLSQLLKRDLLDIPPLGVIGSHPSLLPKGRGRHPLIWALVKGLAESGLTFFYADEGADSGDILWQKPFPITLDDNASTLYEKIKVLADEAVCTFLPQVAAGTPPRIPQDHTQATYWRKRGEADGELHWEQPTISLHNLVRALTHPYVGAHSFVRGERITIWQTYLCDWPGDEALPGTVLDMTDDGVIVHTGDGAILVSDWHGRALSRGDLLGGGAA